jgi:FkbM family methyltransferase
MLLVSHPLFVLRRNSVFRAVSRFLGTRLDMPVFVSIAGFRYPICLRLWANISIIVRRARGLEPLEVASFVKVIRERDCRVLWDVGANIGAYSVAFLSVIRDGAVLALEPDSRNARVLQKTIQKSGLPITILGVAASDTPGMHDFLFDDLTGATGSLVRVEGRTFNELHFGEPPRTAPVPVVTLDSLLDAHPAPDFVKIDVEGNELATLRGAAKILARRPALLIEISQDRAAVCAILHANGYALFDSRTMGRYDDMTHNVLALPITGAL